MTAASSPPERGTRPRNRRDLIVAAASELFHRSGYAHVAVGDIAAAVNVGGSALYRHFGNKAEILVAAIQTGLTQYADTIARSEDLPFPDLIEALARTGVDHPALGVLWQREARNLDDAAVRGLRESMRTITARLAARIQQWRPRADSRDADLVAWCVIGAMVSISFHTVRVPRPELVALLAKIALDIASVSLPSSTPGPSAPEDDTTGEDSTKEQVIAEATSRFADRGFSAVGIDEIGAAVGIAGPSIYSHFPSKQVLLATVIEAGRASLAADTRAVLSVAGGARETLLALLDSYVRFAVANRHVIRILLSEVGQLPDDEQREARRGQREYIDMWVRLRQELIPEDAARTRITVQAVQLVVNDAVQTPHLRTRPDLAADLEAIGRAVLDPDASA